MGAAIVAGKGLLGRGPGAFLEPPALAHAREESDERVPGLEPLGATELKDVRYRLEERHRVLGLDAGRLLHLVRAVRQLLRGIRNQAETCGGCQLQEVP